MYTQLSTCLLAYLCGRLCYPVRGRLVHGLASRPTASGPEALPTHRPRQTVEGLVWFWRATSLTYACIRHRFGKMANMPALSNTHTFICNTIQHHIWAGNTASNSHMCTRSPKTGQSLVLYSILFEKNYATFHYFEQLCVVTQLRRPICNSAVAEWVPRILFWAVPARRLQHLMSLVTAQVP